MKEHNKKILWNLIQQKGKKLSGMLPNHPKHPKGRNSYAHICLLIKEKFGVSYKHIDDNLLGNVLKFIEDIEPK